MPEPRVIEFKSVEDKRGQLIISENETMPFEAKRVFFRHQQTYSTISGGHAHLNVQQMLVCISGRVVVDAANQEGRKWRFNLRSPHCGIHVPAMVWLDLDVAFGSMLMVLCSEPYDEADYIRDRIAYERAAA